MVAEGPKQHRQGINSARSLVCNQYTDAKRMVAVLCRGLVKKEAYTPFTKPYAPLAGPVSVGPVLHKQLRDASWMNICPWYPLLQHVNHKPYAHAPFYISVRTRVEKSPCYAPGCPS
jgi:hypothetical protein